MVHGTTAMSLLMYRKGSTSWHSCQHVAYSMIHICACSRAACSCFIQGRHNLYGMRLGGFDMLHLQLQPAPVVMNLFVLTICVPQVQQALGAQGLGCPDV